MFLEKAMMYWVDSSQRDEHIAEGVKLVAYLIQK